MISTSRRAVFTGLGVLTPIGLGPDAYWEGLRTGRSGIKPITSFDASPLPSRIGGEIRDFEVKNYIDKSVRKSIKVMSRSIQLAVAGAQVALDHARIDKQKLDPTRLGIDFGAGLIATELPELGDAARVSALDTPGRVDLEKWGEQGLKVMTPLWMLKYLPNMLACHVSIIHNAQGPSNTITQNDVGALLSIGEALRILRRDHADVMLVGGADSKLNPLSLTRHALFMPLSRRNDDPEKACRPFDMGRDGVVQGEGAGVLVLEDLEHARRRGATIYAEVVGFGAAFDQRRDGNGIARAIQQALRQANVTPADIDHINAQGNSSVEGDIWEARGIAQVFGSTQPAVPVLAPRSYLGNLSAGGGSTELAASLLALHFGLVPKTLNHDQPDPRCPISVLAGEPRRLTRPYILKISFTELGQCAALVCRRWE